MTEAEKRLTDIRKHPEKDKSMTIIELIKTVSFKDVKRALRFHYPKPKIGKRTAESYEKIFNEMSGYKIREDKTTLLRIHYDEGYSTDGFDKKNNQTCAIEFVPWKKASNFEIDPNVLKHYSPSEIVAHFLWEMTYAGFDQKTIQTDLKKMRKIVREIKGSISHDEARRRIKKERLKGNG